MHSRFMTFAARSLLLFLNQCARQQRWQHEREDNRAVKEGRHHNARTVALLRLRNPVEGPERATRSAVREEVGSGH